MCIAGIIAGTELHGIDLMRPKLLKNFGKRKAREQWSENANSHVGIGTRLPYGRGTEVCTFWECIGPDPYQGTTSVVPTITLESKGFSPCHPGLNGRGLGANVAPRVSRLSAP